MNLRPSISILEVLSALAVIVVLALLLLPVAGFPGSDRVSLARNALQMTVVALKAFQSDYGHFPKVGVEHNGDLEISGENQKLLMQILTNQELSNGITPETRQNSRGIVFFELMKRSKKGGMDKDGTFYDPWGGLYRFVVDTNQDGEVTIPIDWHTQDSGTTLSTSVIGFSPGKKIGTDNSSQQDDVTSW